VRRDERERLEIEALVTDRYLDSLLAARDRRALDVPADLVLAPDVRSVAVRIATGVDRVHPSFRFEERLALELQRMAMAMRSGAVMSEALPFETRRRAARRRRPAASRAATLGRFGRSFGAPHVQLPTVDTALQRPILIGGALTSAALSVAGVYVAWRRGQDHGGPMARAVRAAHGRGAVERGLLTAAMAARSRANRRPGASH